MNLLNSLRTLGFPISKIIEQPIYDDDGQCIAWNVYVQDSNSISLSGGTHSDLETAKRIAVAESFERALARNISKNPESSKEFLIDQFPTSCGFACGFERSSTMERSIVEAVERWAFSKWIDSSLKIEEMKISEDLLTPMQKKMLKNFVGVRLFKKDSILFSLGKSKFNYSFGVILLETVNGCFLGCRAGHNLKDIINHSFIEANRSYRNYELSLKDSLVSTNSIIAQRVAYFANNKSEAIQILDRSTITSWPTPELLISKEYNTGIEGVYLWRSLMKDFVPWHLGSEKRLVY